MKTKEHVEGGWRFRWAGGTFIAVQADSGVWEHVPYDMMELPDWVVSSNLDDEGFQMLCRLWVHRAEARDAVAEVAKAHSISVRCYETMGVPNTEATCACGECDGAIEVGDQIQAAGKLWIHEVCPEHVPDTEHLAPLCPKCFIHHRGECY